MSTKNYRYYKSVPASDNDSVEYTVPNGKTLYIFRMGLSGGSNNDTKIELRWGTDETYDILLATHRDIEQVCDKRELVKCVGDGSKKVKLLMKNDSSQAETLGGYFIGEELDSE